MHFQEYSRIDPHTKGLAIFDRDGTLIENVKGLSKTENVKWLPGRLEVLQELSKKGFTIAIATNQGAVEEGLISESKLVKIHDYIVGQAEENGINIWSTIYCPHSKELTGKTCLCRKPKPGMIVKLIKEYGVQHSCKALFGDSDTDIQAAKSSGHALDSFLVSEDNFQEKVRNWISQS